MSVAMDVMIARPGGSSPRLFPAIRPDLYNSVGGESSDLTPDQQAARTLLALANKGFPHWQRLLGWQLDASGQIGRLLLHHRMAMAAELIAQWQRADFFWQLVYTDFKRLAGRSEVWQALAVAVANRPGMAVLNDPEQLRQHLVHELFIDTHCAFCNGYVRQAAQLTPEDRAFVHLDYIKELLHWSGLSENEQCGMLGPLEESRITLFKEAGKWEQAMQVCTDMLQRFPERVNWQDQLAELAFSSTMARLQNAASEQANTADAATLLSGISRLEKMHQDYPYNVLLFELLGHLHHIRAVKLANLTQLADAMEELQSRVQTLQAELAKQPNMTLNRSVQHCQDGERVQGWLARPRHRCGALPGQALEHES